MEAVKYTPTMGCVAPGEGGGIHSTPCVDQYTHDVTYSVIFSKICISYAL